MFKLKQLSRSNSLRVTKSNRLISAASSVAPDSPMALPELMKNATYKVEVEEGIRAVRLASKLCQAVQAQLSAAEKVDKLDDSPVTVADYGAQALVSWVLSDGLETGLSMVAEEDSASLTAVDGRPMLERITALVNTVLREEEEGAADLKPEDIVKLIDLGSSQGGPAGKHWVLDPIDGTRGFVGMRQYSVCLGMLSDGEVHLGVLGCPNLPQGLISDDDGGSSAMSRAANPDVGCLYFAHKGRGAFSAPLADPTAPFTRIRVKDVSDASEAQFMESFESRHSDQSFAARVARSVGVVKAPLRMDSQVKYGILSRGEAARVFMRFPPSTYREKIWDHAAGVVIVEEAGGRVTDALGNKLDFSQGRYLESMKMGIVAGPPAVHATIIKAIAKM